MNNELNYELTPVRFYEASIHDLDSLAETTEFRNWERDYLHAPLKLKRLREAVKNFTGRPKDRPEGSPKVHISELKKLLEE